MKILKKIGLGIVILLLLIGIVSLFFSTQKEVSRSTVIHAPIENVFKNVNAMGNWKKWGGPWQEEGMDYSKVIQKTLGTTTGVGSKLIYNQGKGDGSVEIIESDLNKRIKTLISFEDGGFANGTWLFNEDNNKTMVTWTVKVNLGYNPLKRIMGNLMMESKVGSVFEKGLVNLKKISE
ncbi:SRPBCC family protein [Aquimarina sp. Aq78]|uniref:SRPBCC family protein n=1 Tax=Aquimarina sp. Aq78 TaxID=1191889 RepID=UPI000D0E9F16|nr:SRPBCC family protein [Aquimarina sp. Aq78]